MFFKKREVFLLCVPLYLHSVVNPLAVYTPLLSLTKVAQTAATLQSLASYVTSPSVTTLSPALSASSTSSSTSITKPITPSSLGTKGQLIQESGYYLLSTSINYTGAIGAITILQSNVVIDLNGQTLSFSGDKSQNVTGIIIAPGLSNITIKNGTIANFPGPGIYAYNPSEEIEYQVGTVSSVTQPSTHLAVDTVRVMFCQHGIMFSATNNVSITNCNTSGNMNPKGNTCGIEADNGESIYVQNCISNYNTSPTGSCFGFLFSQCKTSYVSNCTANGNQGLKETIGIFFNKMISNNYIDSCTCNGNSSTTGSTEGILLKNCFQTFVQDSKSQCNQAIVPSTYAYGIRIFSSSISIVKHNTVDCNDYGIYDDEPAGQQTNIYSQNIAYLNRITGYLRPYSSPLAFIKIDQEHLQGMLLAGPLDNISVQISP